MNDFVYEGDYLKPLTACCDQHLEIRWDDQHHPLWGQPCRRQMTALNESCTHTAMVQKYFLDILQVYTYHPAPFELLQVWDHRKDVDHHHSVKFGKQWTEKPTNLFQRERDGERRRKEQLKPDKVLCWWIYESLLSLLKFIFMFSFLVSWIIMTVHVIAKFCVQW